MKQQAAEGEAVMTQAEQIRFVQELTTNIAQHVIVQIHHGRIPENWDGHELRLLLAMRYADDAQGSAAKNQRTKRGKDFINTVRVNNL